MTVTLDDKADYLDGIDRIMVIGTCQTTGALFYLGKADITSSINNHIIGRLLDKTLQVEASFKELDKLPQVLKPYPAQF